MEKSQDTVQSLGVIDLLDALQQAESAEKPLSFQVEDNYQADLTPTASQLLIVRQLLLESLEESASVELLFAELRVKRLSLKHKGKI